MSQVLKGELQDPIGEPTIFSGEYTDIGESSKDSAIVSVDRERDFTEQEMSVQTVITSARPSVSKEGEQSPAQGVLAITGPPPPSPPPPAQGIDGAPDVEPIDGPPQTCDPEAKEMTIWQKIIHWFTILCLFIESCVISATAKLNHVSRDYRYVSRRLSVEKRALKLLFEMEEADGVSYDTDWKKNTLEKISKASVPQVKRVDSTDSFRKLKRGSDDKNLQNLPPQKSPPAASQE